MPAVALTDRNNLFALVFSKPVWPKVLSHSPVPKYGSERDRRAARAAVTGAETIIAIVDSNLGQLYRQLHAWRVRGAGSCRQEGLIVLSGGVRGHLWSLLRNADSTGARALRWQAHLYAYYLSDPPRASGRRGGVTQHPSCQCLRQCVVAPMMFVC